MTLLELQAVCAVIHGGAEVTHIVECVHEFQNTLDFKFTSNYVQSLAPLSGGGLALSLAYLSLGRFRYRDAVYRRARFDLAQLGHIRDQERTTEHFRILNMLGGGPTEKELEKFKDTQDMLEVPEKFLSDIDATRAISRNENPDDQTFEANGKRWIAKTLFRKFYSSSVDRLVSLLCAAISIISLALGGAEGLYPLWGLGSNFYLVAGELLFWSLTTGVSLIVAFAYFGDFGSFWCQVESVHRRTQIEKHREAAVGEAKIV